MVGTSCELAPWLRRRSVMSPACSLVRGTNTFQPYNARDSHQDSVEREPAASPMVTTSCPLVSPASEPSDASVVSCVRCVLNVPLLVTATGVRSEEHTSELQSRFDLVC